ncbi:MAG: GDSL-type esterase/lipase family protein [Firmicutes bacterium]|nr:GDSL-type esterase/lipase family protein [Bacillota bacterium]
MHSIGVAYNTSRDVSERWAGDVVDLKPHWISLMIGVNDVWRKFDHPESPELHVPLTSYRELIENLVSSMVTNVKGFLLVSPFFLELDRSEPMRVMVDEYGYAMDALAPEYSLPFFDTQKMLGVALLEGRFSHRIT